LGSHPVAVVQCAFAHKNTQNGTEQTIHRTTQKLKSAGRAQPLRVLPWHLSYNCGKARKNLSQGSRRVPAGTMKIHKRTTRHKHTIRK